MGVRSPQAGTQGAGVAAPPEDTSLLRALGMAGPSGLGSMTTAQGGGCPGTLQSSLPSLAAHGQGQQPVSLCLIRTAPKAHSGQPGRGRWIIHFLLLFSPTNFNVWWCFLPETSSVSFPGRGRRVLNPEERPSPSLAAQLPEAIRTAAWTPRDSVKGQSWSLHSAMTHKATSHYGPRQVPWSSSWGQGLPHSFSSPPACLCLLPWLQERGPQHILSRDTELQPRLLVRRVTRQSNSVRKHLATQPEASLRSAAARLSGQGPFHCKLSVVWVTDQVFTPGEDQRQLCRHGGTSWKEGL